MNIDDLDFNFDFDDLPEEEKGDYYPPFFKKWDDAVANKQSPGYVESDDVREIIDIYILDYKIERAWEAIDYTISIHGKDEDIVSYVLSTFSEFELWSDVLKFINKYDDGSYIIAKHKIEALLHLRMEEEAFLVFKEAKKKFGHDREALYSLYYTMGESLFDVNLYEATAHVVQEAIDILGEDLDLYWLQIDSYVSLKKNEQVIFLAEKIASNFPFDAEVWHKLGLCYYNIEEYERAIQSFEFAENLGVDEYSDNLSAIIKAYERNGNTDKALEKVKEFLYLYPDKHNVNLLAASLSADLKDWEEAINFLNKVIKKDPERQEYYLYKSFYYVSMGEYKKAKLTLEEGISKAKKQNNQLIEQLNKLNNQYPDI